MRATFIVLALALGLAVTPAVASEKAPATNPTVLMSPMALPVVIDGKLVNYIFVNVRLQLKAGADSAKLREQEPFFRDAIIRGAYRASVVRAADPNAVDEARLRALVLTETGKVAGRGTVTGLTVLRQRAQKTLRLPARPAPISSGRPTA